MRLRKTAVAAGAAALMMVPATSASGGVSSWESLNPPLIPYQNEEYALLGGATFEQGCQGQFEEQLVHVVRPPDRVVYQARWEEPLYLYDLSEWGAGDVWELIDIACAAFSTGGEVPTPVATGEGTVTWNEQDGSDATGRVVSSAHVRGVLTGDSGDTYRVNGRSHSVFTTDGSGGPPDVDVRFLKVLQR
jgi:hypothetical protein